MLAVIESPLFNRLWPDYWTEDERGEFAVYVAGSPEAGDVIPGSGGCRKIRWSRSGMGKRGGVRVILYRATRFCRAGVARHLCKEHQGKHPSQRAEENRGGNGLCH